MNIKKSEIRIKCNQISEGLLYVYPQETCKPRLSLDSEHATVLHMRQWPDGMLECCMNIMPSSVFHLAPKPLSLTIPCEYLRWK